MGLANPNPKSGQQTQQTQQTQEPVAVTPYKDRYNSTRGDGAALNSILGVLVIAGSAIVIAYSAAFMRKYSAASRGSIPEHRFSYYFLYCAWILAIITAIVASIYIIWTWMDARHPLRTAYFLKHDKIKYHEWLDPTLNTKDKIYPQTFHPTLVDSRSGQRYDPVKGELIEGDFPGLPNRSGYPGISTFSVDKLNRLKANRIFIKRSHLNKLMAAEGVLLLMFLTLFILLTAKDGYLSRSSTGEPLGLCDDDAHRAACLDLAIAAITCAVVAGLLLLGLIACFIARTKLPKQAKQSKG